MKRFMATLKQSWRDWRGLVGVVKVAFFTSWRILET